MTRRVAVLLASVVLIATPPIGSHTRAADSRPAPEAERVAVLDWELAQTLVALGIEPVGVAGAAGYREWVEYPPLPAEAIDLGRRTEPSMTALRNVAPDLIVMSDHYDRGRERLELIAPVMALTMVEAGTDPIVHGLEVARRMAQRLGREEAFAALQKRLHEALDRLRDEVRLNGRTGESVYVIQLRDASHARVFGEGSFVQGVLDRAGLTNAWTGPTNFWGFGLVELTRLDVPADHLVVIGPVPRRAERMMQDSPVWQALAPVRQGRVHRLEPVWFGGGPPSTIRFADLLARALHDGQ